MFRAIVTVSDYPRLILALHWRRPRMQTAAAGSRPEPVGNCDGLCGTSSRFGTSQHEGVQHPKVAILGQDIPSWIRPNSFIAKQTVERSAGVIKVAKGLKKEVFQVTKRQKNMEVPKIRSLLRPWLFIDVLFTHSCSWKFLLLVSSPSLDWTPCFFLFTLLSHVQSFLLYSGHDCWLFSLGVDTVSVLNLNVVGAILCAHRNLKVPNCQKSGKPLYYAWRSKHSIYSIFSTYELNYST